ncbi:rhomboid-like protein [Streptomyces syringium]|uniref:rhomboid-like protein n=1 Tax=Streptomyces syringium TaxID=76729 RepID=UPI0033DBBEB4
MTVVNFADDSAPGARTASGGAPSRQQSRQLPRRPFRLRRLARLLPTPAGTPFTFGYGVILLSTALYTDFGDQATVGRLLRESSTDAAHLVEQPLFVLVASALWIAGGIYSFYGVAFLLVVTALERRVGGARAAGVFLLGHVLATLATELPVAGAVAVGRLPEASMHRLDYGISFGLMACVGALSGLLRPRCKWALLGMAGAMCAQDLMELVDPLASWGHPIALLTGLACVPLVRDAAGRKSAAVGRGAAAGRGAVLSADCAVPTPLLPPWLPRQYAPAGAPQEGAAGSMTFRGAGEEPLDGGRAEPVGRAPVEAEAPRHVMGVDDGLHHAHGGEAGPVGVAPRVPGAVPRPRTADGAGEQRRRDADALQAG